MSKRAILDYFNSEPVFSMAGSEKKTQKFSLLPKKTLGYKVWIPAVERRLKEGKSSITNEHPSGKQMPSGRK